MQQIVAAGSPVEGLYERLMFRNRHVTARARASVSRVYDSPL
jgi:hypothetical protein